MREQSKPRIAYLARKGTSVIYLDEFSAAWIDLEKSRLGREVTTEDIKERYPAGHLDKARRWNNTDDIAKAAEEFYSSLREDIRTKKGAWSIWSSPTDEGIEFTSAYATADGIQTLFNGTTQDMDNVRSLSHILSDNIMGEKRGMVPKWINSYSAAEFAQTSPVFAIFGMIGYGIFDLCATVATTNPGFDQYKGLVYHTVKFTKETPFISEMPEFVKTIGLSAGAATCFVGCAMASFAVAPLVTHATYGSLARAADKARLKGMPEEAKNYVYGPEAVCNLYLRTQPLEKD